MERLGLYSNRPRGDILCICKIFCTFFQKKIVKPLLSIYKYNEFIFVHLAEGLKEFMLLFKQYGLVEVVLVY